MIDDTNTGTESVSKEDHEKAVERARKLEAQTVDLTKKLERFKDVDPEAYKAIKEDYELLRKEKAITSKEELDKLISKTREEVASEYKTNYGTKIEDLTKTLTTVQQENKRLSVINPVMREAAEVFLTDGGTLELIQPIIERSCENRDGKIVVLDEKGNVRPSPTNPRLDMTPREFLDLLAEKHTPLARSKMTSGGKSDAERTSTSSGQKYTAQQIMGMSKAQIDKIAPEDLEAALG